MTETMETIKTPTRVLWDEITGTWVWAGQQMYLENQVPEVHEVAVGDLTDSDGSHGTGRRYLMIRWLLVNPLTLSRGARLAFYPQPGSQWADLKGPLEANVVSAPTYAGDRWQVSVRIAGSSQTVTLPLRHFRYIASAFPVGALVTLSGLGTYVENQVDSVAARNLQDWKDRNPNMTGNVWFVARVDGDDAVLPYAVAYGSTWSEGIAGRWTSEQFLQPADAEPQQEPEPVREIRLCVEGDVYRETSGQYLLMSSLRAANDEKSRMMFRFATLGDALSGVIPVGQTTGYIDMEPALSWTYERTLDGDVQDHSMRILRTTMATLNTLRSQVRTANEETARLQQQWDDLSERAGELASRKGYCREYDEMAKELGLTPRERDYTVTVDVTVRVVVNVTAPDEDSAGEEATERAEQALNGHYVSDLGCDLDVQDSEVYDTSED